MMIKSIYYLLTVSLVILNIEASPMNIFKNCNVTKGCYGIPEDCISYSNCSVVMTYTGIEEQMYKMELAGKGKEIDYVYVAMGLSLQAAMGNGTVMACTSTGIDSYWNTENHTSSIQSGRPGITNITHRMEDGFLICTFHLAATFSIPIGQASDIGYNLNIDEYHLMVAAGPLLSNGSLSYHGGNRSVDVNTTVMSVFNSHIKDDVYTDCARADRGCWGFPDGCINLANCTVVVSWVGVAKGTYKIKMTGGVSSINNGRGYLALGFSTSGAMGPGLVIACLAGNTTGSPVQVYWNTESHTSSPLDQQTGVNPVQLTVDNDSINCEFEMLAELSGTKPGTTDTFSVDLNNNYYHLLLAKGPVHNGMIIHHTERASGTDKVILSKYNQFYNDTEWYSNCSTTWGCIGLPDGCVQARNCQVFGRWRGIAVTMYEFQLVGAVKDGQYLAIALSSDNKMGNDSVTVCTVDAGISMYWNTATPYACLPMQDSQQGLHNTNVSVKDGIMTCSFIRDSNTNFTIPEQFDTADFNLNIQKYFLMTAIGPTSSGHEPLKHIHKSVSTFPINFREKNPYLTESIYKGCYESKGCYGSPNDCVLYQDCDMMVTYTKVATDKFKFEVMRATTLSNTYVAIGLSTDKLMANTSVVACGVFQNNVKFDVSMYWNTESYKSKRFPEPKDGLSEITAKLDGGYLTCTFIRDGSMIISPPAQNDSFEFDLNNRSYYLQLAKGPTSSTGLILHHDAKDVSDDPVDLFSFSSVSSYSDLLIKLHGILMVLAWMGTANLGIFPARYCKSLFQDKGVLGKDLWLGLHQILMTLTILFTISGMVVIIVDKKFVPITNKILHAMFGLVAVVLSIVQPSLAMLRCDRQHRHRPVFNWIHGGIGLAAVGMSLVSIGLAVDLARLPPYTLYLVYAYIIWLVVSHGVMTIYQMVKKGEALQGLEDDGIVRTGWVVFTCGIVPLCMVVIIIVCLK